MILRIASEHLAHETVDGEVVILDSLHGTYYSLSGAGAELWELFAEARARDDVADALAARYDADAAAVRAAVLAVIGELVGEALLVPAGEARPIPAGDGARRAFAPPRLEKFTDLQDILLLDPIHEVDEAGWPRAVR